MEIPAVQFAGRPHENVMCQMVCKFTLMHQTCFKFRALADFLQKLSNNLSFLQYCVQFYKPNFKIWNAVLNKDNTKECYNLQVIKVI